MSKRLVGEGGRNLYRLFQTYINHGSQIANIKIMIPFSYRSPLFIHARANYLLLLILYIYDCGRVGCLTLRLRLLVNASMAYSIVLQAIIKALYYAIYDVIKIT